MPDTIKLKAATTLKHRCNLGEEAEEIEFEEGQELIIIREWDAAFLAKDEDGKLFNVKKELAEES